MKKNSLPVSKHFSTSSGRKSHQLNMGLQAGGTAVELSASNSIEVMIGIRFAQAIAFLYVCFDEESNIAEKCLHAVEGALSLALFSFAILQYVKNEDCSNNNTGWCIANNVIFWVLLGLLSVASLVGKVLKSPKVAPVLPVAGDPVDGQVTDVSIEVPINSDEEIPVNHDNQEIKNEPADTLVVENPELYHYQADSSVTHNEIEMDNYGPSM